MTDPGHQRDGLPGLAPTGQELAERFWDRIRHFACRRLGDATQAEDVAQETLRRVATALSAGGVDNLEALPGFVFQTARHICQQHQRSLGREARALARLHGGRPSAADPDALTLLITDERRHAVRAALERLPADEQDLLRRIYYHEEDVAAIAAHLGVTPGALRVRKHRLLKGLRELLREAGS